MATHIPSPTETDPDKYRLVLENEHVRVYDYVDQPGDRTQLHHHDAFVLHALSPFKRKLTFENGESSIKEFKGGETFWAEAQNHIGENIGETETHVLIVELKIL
jgi:quercetin dioxygenase-like cupin family protein